jgi:hypothetical protein
MTAIFPPLFRTSFFLIFVSAAMSSLSRADPPVTIGSALSPAAARVVAIDLAHKAIVLEIKNKQYTFAVNHPVVDPRTRRPLDLQKLALGQFIGFVSQPGSSGEMEIIALAVTPSDGASPLREGGISYGGPPGNGPPEVTPFQ